MSRVNEYRIIIYNRIFIPTVREGAGYVTRTPKPYIRFAPYIYGFKPYRYEYLLRRMSGSSDNCTHSRLILRHYLTDNW